MPLSDLVYLLAAAALALAALLIRLLRPAALGRTESILLIAGLVLMVLANVGWTFPSAPDARPIILVDLSPSTRVAAYRQSDYLHRRIEQLLGYRPAPAQIRYFGDGLFTPPTSSGRLPDAPARHTSLPALEGAAILVFSDARFHATAPSPPLHLVIDPLLETPADAAVSRADQRANAVVALVRSTAAGRSVRARSAAQGVPAGQSVAQFPGRADIIALDAGDDYPENDQLAVAPDIGAADRLLWIGPGPAPQGWQATPAPPTALADYAGVRLAIVRDLAAEHWPLPAQQALNRYVQQMGGGLILAGGEHAFAAGQWHNTLLDRLSPLASHPPTPRRHWLVLVDASGSMDQPLGDATRFAQAARAAAQAAAALPSDDLLSAAGFSDQIDWWFRAERPQRAQTAGLAPPGLRPRGATNLLAVLEAISTTADELPRAVLIITDGEVPATPEQIQRVIDALRRARVQVHALLIGQHDAPAVRQLVEAGGGHWRRSADPADWERLASQVLRQAGGDLFINANFRIDLANPPIVGQRINRTFLRQGATALASADTADGPMPLAARWSAGLGQVLAIAADAMPESLASLAGRLTVDARPPGLRLTLDYDTQWIIRLQQLDADEALRPRAGRLALDSAAPIDMELSAPGVYQARIESRPEPAAGVITLDNQLAARFVLPGRYAPEFDRLGNDHDAMRRLAEQTGGSVITPAQQSPVRLAGIATPAPLRPWLIAAGALLIAAALVLWRFSPR